ncbi:hypothetical protein CCNA_03452 [Caulobacter vibrioides NA1000]|uniref:Uncharacterized protein n=1 Tax=Caulobacter vibrioides (strain NA1000 / CB15N) TaxID=565050 RepID=A0A0H3CCB6_CAUVN|nr:hypothetical protein [Caulobacter vibrioides]YP_002518825.1 hypothetical protein CCNA_03452 [Caulobacter vibrioides NA1000]ACL96917.1 hypothetical protein CCNA_03452 [Caulobacter vibrioides NA1000]
MAWPEADCRCEAEGGFRPVADLGAKQNPSSKGRGRGPPRSGGRERGYEVRRRAGAPSGAVTPLPNPLPLGEGAWSAFHP